MPIHIMKSIALTVIAIAIAIGAVAATPAPTPEIVFALSPFQSPADRTKQEALLQRFPAEDEPEGELQSGEAGQVRDAAAGARGGTVGVVAGVRAGTGGPAGVLPWPASAWIASSGGLAAPPPEHPRARPRMGMKLDRRVLVHR